MNSSTDILALCKDLEQLADREKAAFLQQFHTMDSSPKSATGFIKGRINRLLL